MKGFSLVVLAASLVSASPIARSPAPVVDDTYIEQLALTLEHLEANFYQTALAKFDEAAFKAAGFPPFVRGRITQIFENESAHVAFLTKTLQDAGKTPVSACEYEFPITDPASVVTISASLEHGGGAAYLGALPLIQDKDVQAAAASIASIEHRQAGWVDSAVKHQEPWDGSFSNHLGARQIFTIASGFIKSCPPGNFDLGLTPFSPLTLSPPELAHETSVKVSHGDNTSGPLFLAYITGLSAVFEPIVNGVAKVPPNLKGTVYAVVTNSGTSATDADTVAGPVELRFPFDSNATEA